MFDQILKLHGKRLLSELTKNARRRGKCLLFHPDRYATFTRAIEPGIYFTMHAHVAMWVLKTGRRPKGYVLHTCDNPGCIEFSHLWEGSAADNMADKVAKNRQTKGTAFKHSKLDETKVRRIRRLYRKGIGMPALAVQYNVTLQAIAAVIHRKTWKHVN